VSEKQWLVLYVPINAISYLTSSLARQGKYGRRPNVEIPENTESALRIISFDK
jgi:hypothetical protein